MTRKLFEIIDESAVKQIIGAVDVDVKDVVIDSRKATEGSVFVAIRGYQVDGHQYIDKAVANGASVIVCEEIPDVDAVTIIQVEDTKEYLGVLSKSYYHDPSRDVSLIGVTGTNGKTTVTTLLYQLFSALGRRCGLISTVEYRIGDEIFPSTHTTPDNLRINELLKLMKDSGCSHVFMEVSSHAIDQQRIAGLSFDCGVFTNMSHDHLDYHKTFKDYIWAKKKFFDQLSTDACAIVNIDDKRGEVMMQNCNARLKSYALRQMADFKGRIIENTIDGLVLNINDHQVHYRLVGAFNAYNLLAVYGVADELGVPSDRLLAAMSGLKGAEGRFERVSVERSSVIGIVDYAHTPDALENVLATISKTKHKDAKVISIVGCGGDRDKSKRPIMAKVSYQWSDHLIITSDNPRTEDPEVILDDMEKGLEDEDRKRILRISDRAKAISEAVSLAKAGDVILVAGKGHEKYQDINGVKTPFDDKKVLEAAMRENA